MEEQSSEDEKRWMFMVVNVFHVLHRADPLYIGAFGTLLLC